MQWVWGEAQECQGLVSISGAFDVGGLCNTLRVMSSVIAGSRRICGACVWNTADENLRGKCIELGRGREGTAS